MRAAIISALFLSVIAFIGGIVAGARSTSATSQPAAVITILGSVFTSEPEDVDFSPVWKAWHTIDERFVPTGELAATSSSSTPTGYEDKQQRIWGMIQGLAASLDDPYTVFLPPSDAEIFQDDISGAFEGVGMEIAIRDNVLTVVSPLKGTPAFRAGIKGADKVIEIDGVSTKGMDITEAVKRIRGPRGTAVALTIIREGEPNVLEINVERDVINIPTISSTRRGDGVFVIELLNFSAVSPNLFRNELRNFILQGDGKLVLDLRGNPGGYLEAAVDIASWFLPSGKVVVTEDYGDNQDPIVHRSRGYNLFTDKLKMVILVDKGSASASEILAGALSNYGVATIVGTETFGKGSVQELVNITPETSLKITVARWLLPDGTPIPHTGIEPDVEAKITDDDIMKGLDPQMDKAVEILLSQ